MALLPNEKEYYLERGTVKRIDKKYKRITRKERSKIRYEKKHPHILTAKEKRIFRNYLKRVERNK
jgi:hypothetical protein